MTWKIIKWTNESSVERFQRTQGNCLSYTWRQMTKPKLLIKIQIITTQTVMILCCLRYKNAQEVMKRHCHGTGDIMPTTIHAWVVALICTADLEKPFSKLQLLSVLAPQKEPETPSRRVVNSSPGACRPNLERFLQLPEQELQTLESAGGWSQTAWRCYIWPGSESRSGSNSLKVC